MKLTFYFQLSDCAKLYLQTSSYKCVKVCLDYMICLADFVMYDFVIQDFSVYTGITNHVWFLFPSAFIHEKRKWREIILLFRYVS